MTSFIRPILVGNLLAIVLGLLGLPLPSVVAQANNGPAQAAVSTRFVPDDAFAVLFASPAELVQNDLFASFPVELFQLQMKAAFGIDPNDIALAKIILGLPDPSQPAFGIVLEMTRPFDEARLLEALRTYPDPTTVGDFTAYPIGVGPPGTLLHKVDDKTILITLPNYLPSMLAANQGTGPLPTMMAKTPAGPGINLLMVMEAVRPVVSRTAIDMVERLPPHFLPLAELPELAESAQIAFQFTDRSAKFNFTITGIDGDAAERTEEILKDAIDDSRDFVPDFAKRTMPRNADDEMRAAIDKYVQRITKQVFDAVAVKRTETDVKIAVELELGVSAGIVISNFLPPVERMIRTLSRQLDGSNNMRQIMLAIHNYHSAYNRLPPPAITDADGKPLLSWRVAVLPFIQEQALYQQFRLNEPWDSEHNLPLSKRLPNAFASAGLRLPPGQTVVHAVVGDEIGMRASEKTAFRDFLDGLSNTILVIESTADSAVPWSKPEDVSIDLEEPLAKFIGSPRKSFRVGMGDGAVTILADDIDPVKFKAMLTRAGGERIVP